MAQHPRIERLTRDDRAGGERVIGEADVHDFHTWCPCRPDEA